jgi:apolipoprotein N-acyltransferase
MNQIRKNLFTRMSSAYGKNLAWLWLIVGFILLPFTLYQTVIWEAGWLAPIFLLRFSRTSRHAWVYLPLIAFSYIFAINFASRGLPFNLLGFIGAVLFKGLMWMLPYAADRILGKKLLGWSRSLVFPLAFTLVDWVLSILRVSSAGSPAYSQAGNLALLQVISITGMWGITFLIMWGGSVINAWWECNFDWRPVRSQLITFAGVLVAVLLFGIVQLALPTQDFQAVKAATITLAGPEAGQTPDFGIYWLTFYQYTPDQRAAIRPKLEATVDQMLSRTDTALQEGAKVVAWQESAAWVLIEDQSSVLNRISYLANRYQAMLMVSMEVFTHATSMPYLYNQSILVDPTGTVLWIYDKTHPVIFDEAFITIAGPGILPIVDSPYGRLSTAICYDTYFPTLLRQAGAAGTDIFFAPTHDVSVWESSALAMADYRAIEDGFTMIRPTGNGISAIIDSRGRILASQNFTSSDTGIMLTTLPTHTGVKTIFSQVGYLLPYLCLAGFIFLIPLALLQRNQKAHYDQSKPVTI